MIVQDDCRTSVKTRNTELDRSLLRHYLETGEKIIYVSSSFQAIKSFVSVL